MQVEFTGHPYIRAVEVKGREFQVDFRNTYYSMFAMRELQRGKSEFAGRLREYGKGGI